MLFTAVLFWGLVAAASHSAKPAAKPVDYVRRTDVVYSRSYGTALTMDVFEPKGKANGATIVWVVSGGWFSNHDSINPENSVFCPVKPLISRGYRVCAVVHRSNPYFTIEDAITDVERSIRFIRHEAIADGHSTMPIGIMGASAGGHLSLIAGTCGDDGNKLSLDPVEQTSNRVQAVACYFPPTDFLNFGAPHVNGTETTIGKMLQAAFQFRRLNAETRTMDRVATQSLIRKILRNISPIRHVSPDDAPTLIIQGDADPLVPIQQAEIFIDRMTSAGVEAKLLRRPGKGHGWIGIEKDNELLYDWFDKHLLPKK